MMMQPNPSSGGDIFNTLSGTGLSNEARLKLLEKRLAGQDVVDGGGQRVEQGAQTFQMFPPSMVRNQQQQIVARNGPPNQWYYPQEQVHMQGGGPGMRSGYGPEQLRYPAQPGSMQGGYPSLLPGTYAPRQPLGVLQNTQQPQQILGPGQQGMHRTGSANLGETSTQKPGPGREPGPPTQKRKRASSPMDQQPYGSANNFLSPGPSDAINSEATPVPGNPNPAAARALFTSGPGSGGAQARTMTRSASKAAATAARTSGGKGQTRLNAFYPVVDGSSRDSELSAGHPHGYPMQAGAGGMQGSAAQQQQHQQQQHQQQQQRAYAASPSQSNLLVPQASGSTGQLTRQGSGLRTGGGVSPLRTTTNMTEPMQHAALHHARSAPLAAIPEHAPPQAQLDVRAVVAQATARLTEQLAAKDKQVAELQQQTRQNAGAERRVSELSQELSVVTSRLEAMHKELDRSSKAAEEKEAKLRSELMRVLCSSARDKRELSRLQLATAGVQLGSITVHRTGLTLQEAWEEGQVAAALALKQGKLAQQREEVEAARKALRKKLAPPPSAVRGGGSEGGRSSTGGPEGGYMDGHEFVTLDEIYKMRLAALKREEESLKDEMDRLSADKARHVRALKRLRDEEGSRFGCGSTVLGGRFVLLSMLGKGGFSEVFKAYDLRDLRVVAAKVHQLNPGWSEARKASYVKHAIREVDIQKALRHAHIVSLVDLLEVDAHCFATVLEFCEGGDLDTLLREHTVLPEKEARSIISQVMSGLNYLNQPGRRIIHYDLKPANILFDNLGAAKITDFGLSKVVEEGATQGLELTSQGAGTYWYLPPECFEIGGPHAPRITNKVDVWSVGVIFYQMLFGKRPYGEGLSQEQIMRDKVVLGAKQVEFPAKPSVSGEAKEFIRRCLALRAEQRWDVAAAAADPYISSRK